MTDLNKLSDNDLMALSNNDLTKVSDEGLLHLSGAQTQEAPKQEPTMLNRFMGHPVDTYAQEAQNLAGGVAGGVANTAINAANLVQAVPSDKATEYKAAVQQKLADLGVKPESGAYGAGQVGGEIAVTYPIGGALGGAAKLAKAPERIVQALKSGGLSTGGEKGFTKNLIAKTVAGADVGALTGQLIAPEDNGGRTGGIVGGGVSAATSIINPAAKLGYRIVEPVFERGREAMASRKMRDIAGDAENIPGMVEQLRSGGLTPEQLAVKMDSPELAGSIKTSEEQFPKERGVKRAAEAEALASKVNQAQSSLNAIHQGEMPVSGVSVNAPYQNVRDAVIAQKGALEYTKAARTAELLRQAETAQAGLEEAKQGIVNAVAQPLQRDVGLTLAEKKAELEKAARVEPSKQYTAAYGQAPEKFSFQPLLDAAGDIKNNLSTEIDRHVAPKVHEILKALKSKEDAAPQILGANGKPLNPKTGDLPFEGTLQEAHALRSAILKDRREIERSTNGQVNLTKSNLEKLEAGINQTIAQGAPESAGETFTGANKLFRESVAAPYMEGMAKKLTVENTLSRPSLNPSEVTEKALHPDHSVDFVNAFGSDPEAMQTIEAGIEGKFRSALKKGGQAGADFIEKHSEALDTLDAAPASAGIKDRLSGFVRDFGSAEAKQAALGEQIKAIPKVVDESVANQQRIIGKSAKDLSGATDAENLAKVAVNADARVMGRILHKLTPEAKPELARQVINNAFEPITAGVENAGAKTAKALENSRIAVALKATYGKEEGAAKLADFKETANIQSLIESVKKEAPAHPYDTAQALDNLTEGKPQVKRAVEDILATLSDQRKFAELASSGRKAKEGTIKMATEATPTLPFSLTEGFSLVKWIHTSLLKSADAKLADKISKELMSSEAFATALERAQKAEEYAIPSAAIEYGRILPRTAAGAVTSITGEK
jgi:hypothetical protein